MDGRESYLLCVILAPEVRGFDHSPPYAQLKFLRTPFQEKFINAPDLPWGSEDATVRVVGEGAGNMTYILMGGAGHMVSDFMIAWISLINLCDGGRLVGCERSTRTSQEDHRALDRKSPVPVTTSLINMWA